MSVRVRLGLPNMMPSHIPYGKEYDCQVVTKHMCTGRSGAACKVVRFHELGHMGNQTPALLPIQMEIHTMLYFLLFCGFVLFFFGIIVLKFTRNWSKRPEMQTMSKDLQQITSARYGGSRGLKQYLSEFF